MCIDTLKEKITLFVVWQGAARKKQEGVQGWEAGEHLLMQDLMSVNKLVNERCISINTTLVYILMNSYYTQ